VNDLPRGWSDPLARLAEDNISPEIALTLILLARSEPDPAGKIVQLASARQDDASLGRLAKLVSSYRSHVERAGALVQAGIDPAPAGSADGIVASTRDHFDRLAADAPEAGVALYTLGHPELLAAATAELVEVVARWTELQGSSVLDFGCGIGRVSAALAPLAAEVVGVDVSPAMISQAKARVAAPNVRFEVGSGVDLCSFDDCSFDLVLAVDSFPYLVRAGDDVVRIHVQEAARLLRPGGTLLVFNWSYRGDLARDASDALRLGNAVGFRPIRTGEQPFRIWNAAGFQLVRA
jgi:SAM-dependent methyltransferase